MRHGSIASSQLFTRFAPSSIRLPMPLVAKHNLPRAVTMATSAATSSPRKLKILMLHGYTQSGPLFHAKTRALEKALQKAFPALPPAPHDKKPLPGSLPSYPGGIELIYPTAPMRLRPADIPGWDSSSAAESDESQPDSWAWWRRETGTAVYAGLDDGLATIASAIRTHDGIDGVVGFSQGACAAAFVASLLEPGRFAAFKAAGKHAFPASFGSSEAERVNVPLRFCVSYCGFYAPGEEYRAFYEPKISTPMLHFIGSLDSVVEERRSLDLVEATVGQRTVYHPGGHFVPIGKEMVGALVGFIRETCGEKAEVEESVEDMDVPF